MLVSVYIPTRNRVGLLAKAIDSVFAQTYKDIELVVVNDASCKSTYAAELKANLASLISAIPKQEELLPRGILQF